MSQNTKVLVHEMGKESKIVVKKSEEITEKDFFYTQYEQALKAVNNYCKNVDAESNSTFENLNNIITFIGERGSGKTSCMLTFANILNDGKDKFAKINDRKFYLLPVIDPSFFSKNYNIIGSFIATIYRQFNEHAKSSNNNLEEGKRHDFFSALAKAQKSYGRLSSEMKHEFDDIEKLEQLTCALQLKDDIRDLVKKFLDCIGERHNMIVLSIDDIDLNTKTAVEMLEWIRKYLIQPNIVILFALKLDQMTDLKRLSLIKEYKEILDKNRMSESEIDEMAERYIAKLFPLANRVYMPKAELLPNALYLQKGEGIEKSEILKEVVAQKIFDKTRFMFYNLGNNANLIVPGNLREVLHLLRMLDDMKEIIEEKNNDGTNSEEREDVLRTNQTIFKQYLFDDCLLKNLNSESRELINELIEVSEASMFNATVLRILVRKFDSVLKKYIYERENTKEEQDQDGNIVLLTENTIKYNVRKILEPTNMSYNVSFGDVMWLIGWIEKMERTNEELYFLFILNSATLL